MVTVSNQLYAPSSRLFIPQEKRVLNITALVSPTLLSEQEMGYLVRRRREIWGGYAHDDVPALVGHIQERPGTIYIARLNGTSDSTDGIVGGLEIYKLQTHGDPKNIPPTAEEVRSNGDAKEPDTMLLFQFESYDDSQRIRGQVTIETILYAIENFKQYPNLFTYSPKEAVRIHRRFGAVPVHVFPNGRRHHIDPHVVINSYWSETPLKGLTDQEIDEWVNGSLQNVPNVLAT
ncbi:MAG: hypothetical protein HY361_04040 [Candidatus Aenigmarchaeota archaeon]|nr:hypothetical protein [Candidatus Aenigmarchaeota archaeon]